MVGKQPGHYRRQMDEEEEDDDDDEDENRVSLIFMNSDLFMDYINLFKE